jgi:protocatechuate 3,4-dioxygenase alpha subunit
LAAEYTPSQTIGPFFAILLPLGSDELVDPKRDDAITLAGRVYDGAGAPVVDALLEMWQADGNGKYASRGGFGRYMTDAAGGFRFVTSKPGRVEGTDERLQAPHVSVSLFARGLLKRLATRVYFEDEPSNEKDPVLLTVAEGRRSTLVARRDGAGVYRFDIHLQGENETVFFAV